MPWHSKPERDAERSEQKHHACSCQQWSADRPPCFRMLGTSLDHLRGGVESTNVRGSGNRFSMPIFTPLWSQSHWACTCAPRGLRSHVCPNCLFPFTEREHICHPFWTLPWHNTLGHKSMSCPWGVILGKQHKVSGTQSSQDACLSTFYLCIYLFIYHLRSHYYLSNLHFNIAQGSLEKQNK